MLTAIIVICIIIFVTSAIKGNKKKSRHIAHPIPKEKPQIVSVQRKHNDSYNRKLPALEQRMNRQKRIWSVLFIANSIHNCQAEYTTRRDWQYLDSAIEAVNEYKPTYMDIITAIRFCQIEYVRGCCDHKLTKQDLFIIRNIRQLVATNQLPVNRPIQYS